MKKILYALIIVSILLMAGCKKENGMEEEGIKQTAAVVAKDFMEERGKTFVMTGYDFLDSSTGSIVVYGYCKEDKDNKMLININYMQDFKVLSYGDGVED
ncbi:hypothetical protein LCY76_20775 [Fictibacillus sp. KIGAM418]|uniref:DUF1433 domain-containing protein n=1 Tax=Fictibacillus marinisediminis TaxID=2878389 RepID=A0A9X1XFM4_9BACL|nr:hypothetical protein [Fictibacillus marinisediminis]MCK6259010.1 hypothetical protein [Fictibacillus marinisediminis]